MPKLESPEAEKNRLTKVKEQEAEENERKARDKEFEKAVKAKMKVEEKRYKRLDAELAKHRPCFMAMEDKIRDKLDLLGCLECVDFDPCHKLSVVKLASHAADNYCAYGGDCD